MIIQFNVSLYNGKEDIMIKKLLWIVIGIGMLVLVSNTGWSMTPQNQGIDTQSAMAIGGPWDSGLAAGGPAAMLVLARGAGGGCGAGVGGGAGSGGGMGAGPGASIGPGPGASVGPGPGANMGSGPCDGTGKGSDVGHGSGHGPGDGTGNDGQGPQDGTGYGATDH